MKKILIIIILLLNLSIIRVKAQTEYRINLDYQPNIYYARVGGTLPYMSSQFAIYRFNDIIAYCIDPAHNITTYNYVDKDNEINLNYSDEIKEKIALYGYYGGEYPSHDDIKYSMAAQALIWEITSGQTVTFWTKRYEEGKKIDISKERKEILDLVSKHHDKPDFSNNDFNGYLNHEMIFKDNKNLLNNFEISDNGGNEVTIDGNILKVIPKKIGNSQIVLSKKRYDGETLLTFVGKDKSSSQVLARLRFNSDVNININLDIEGSKIKILKKDDNGQNIEVAGIKFKIKNLDTNSYVCESEDCLFKTNDKGYFITNNYYNGRYEIEEIEDQIVDGYLWNSDKIYVDINDNSNIKWDDEIGNYLEVDFINKRINGIVNIIKKGEEVVFENNEISYAKINLSDIKFSLFDNNDQLIGTLKTDNNGYAKYDHLSIGKYYLMENTKLGNYISNDNKYYFEIKQDNQYDEMVEVTVNIDNYLTKGTVDFSKEDFVTNEGIPNTIMELYNEKDELLLTRETNEEGKITIDKLPIGRYYFLEKEANSMYQITNEKVFFEIKANNEIVKAKMFNEKIVVEVPKTDDNSNITISIISGIMNTIGIGGMVIEKKKDL